MPGSGHGATGQLHRAVLLLVGAVVVAHIVISWIAPYLGAIIGLLVVVGMFQLVVRRH
jgi:nitrate reductase gamma subunit